MTTTDVREVALNAVQPFLDPALLEDLTTVLPGMDYQAVRNLLGEVDGAHQRINTLRLDIITLVSAEAERQGLKNDATKDTPED